MVEERNSGLTAALMALSVALTIVGVLFMVPAGAAQEVEEPQPTEETVEAAEEATQAAEASDTVAEEAREGAEDTTEVSPEISLEVGGARATVTLDDDDPVERSDRRRHRRSVDKDTQIHFGSDLVIREDEVARDAIVFSGSLDVQGKVIGDAVVILGSMTIDGEVTGEVVVVGGSVYIGADAEVMGDVTSVGGNVERESGARILGGVNEISYGPGIVWPELPLWRYYDGPHRFGLWDVGPVWNLFWTLFKWVLLLMLTSLIYLVAREPVERTSRQIRSGFWKSSLLGLVAIVFFPFLFIMVIIVLAITIIGIPLLIVVIPLAVMLVVFALLLGYTAAAYSTGKWLGRRFGWSLESPYLALVVGVVAIQSLSLFASLLGHIGGYVWFFAMMFGLAGWFVRFFAWTTGFGAALLTQLGRREPLAPPPAAVVPTAPAAEASAVDAAPVSPPRDDSSGASDGSD